MEGLIPKTKLFLKHHGSTILTSAAALGVVATTISAVVATPKATRLLEKAKKEKGNKLTKLETVRVAAPSYIPSLLIGAATITCIFGANVLNKRQQASLIGLYSLVNSSFNEYKNKVNEVFGDDANNKIMSAMAHDRCEEHPKKNEDTQLFMDFNSLQVFESRLEDVKKAEELVNDLLNARGFVYLNEYYEALGLTSIYEDYQRGWSKKYLERHGYDHIPFIHDKSLITPKTEGEPECYLITTEIEPIYDSAF